jgi:hypothetical protein
MRCAESKALGIEFAAAAIADKMGDERDRRLNVERVNHFPYIIFMFYYI